MGIPFIIDEIFKQLLGSSPKYDTEFVNIKSFLSEIKADLCELKTLYNLDFFLREHSRLWINQPYNFFKITTNSSKRINPEGCQ